MHSGTPAADPPSPGFGEAGTAASINCGGMGVACEAG